MTEMKMATPGERTIHGAVPSMERASLIMLPHSAIGGLAPSPRKESPANSIIIVPISRTDVTRIGPMILGSICLNTIFKVPVPESLAASINAVSLRAKVWLLASLANLGQLTAARAILAL